MTLKLLEQNLTSVSSIEDIISSIFNIEGAENSKHYTSLCEFLGVKKIEKKDKEIYLTTRPLALDIFLQSLSEERLKKLVRAIISEDNSFKHLDKNWQEKFILELSSNRDLIVWIKKKIGDNADTIEAQKKLMGGYHVEGENVVKRISLKEFFEGKKEEELKRAKIFITRIIAASFETEEIGKFDFSVSSGVDAKLAAANLNIDAEELEWLTSHDIKKRSHAVAKVIEKIKLRLEIIEEKAKLNGIDHIRMLEDLLAPATAPTMQGIKNAVERANFTVAIKVIKFFEEALEKIETLASYVPHK